MLCVWLYGYGRCSGFFGQLTHANKKVDTRSFVSVYFHCTKKTTGRQIGGVLCINNTNANFLGYPHKKYQLFGLSTLNLHVIQ